MYHLSPLHSICTTDPCIELLVPQDSKFSNAPLQLIYIWISEKRHGKAIKLARELLQEMGK